LNVEQCMRIDIDKEKEETNKDIRIIWDKHSNSFCYHYSNSFGKTESNKEKLKMSLDTNKLCFELLARMPNFCAETISINMNYFYNITTTFEFEEFDDISDIKQRIQTIQETIPKQEIINAFKERFVYGGYCEESSMQFSRIVKTLKEYLYSKFKIDNITKQLNKQLPYILSELGLKKKRKSNGIHWYNISENKVLPENNLIVDTTLNDKTIEELLKKRDKEYTDIVDDLYRIKSFK